MLIDLDDNQMDQFERWQQKLFTLGPGTSRALLEYISPYMPQSDYAAWMSVVDGETRDQLHDMAADLMEEAQPELTHALLEWVVRWEHALKCHVGDDDHVQHVTLEQLAEAAEEMRCDTSNSISESSSDDAAYTCDKWMQGDMIIPKQVMGFARDNNAAADDYSEGFESYAGSSPIKVSPRKHDKHSDEDMEDEDDAGWQSTVSNSQREQEQAELAAMKVPLLGLYTQLNSDDMNISSGALSSSSSSSSDDGIEMEFVDSPAVPSKNAAINADFAGTLDSMYKLQVDRSIQFRLLSKPRNILPPIVKKSPNSVADSFKDIATVVTQPSPVLKKKKNKKRRKKYTIQSYEATPPEKVEPKKVVTFTKSQRKIQRKRELAAKEAITKTTPTPIEHVTEAHQDLVSESSQESESEEDEIVIDSALVSSNPFTLIAAQKATVKPVVESRNNVLTDDLAQTIVSPKATFATPVEIKSSPAVSEKKILVQPTPIATTAAVQIPVISKSGKKAQKKKENRGLASQRFAKPEREREIMDIVGAMEHNVANKSTTQPFEINDITATKELSETTCVDKVEEDVDSCLPIYLRSGQSSVCESAPALTNDDTTPGSESPIVEEDDINIISVFVTIQSWLENRYDQAFQDPSIAVHSVGPVKRIQ